MENIFEGTKKQKKYQSIIIETSLLEKLKKLGKSYNEAVKHLLNINPYNSLKLKLEGLEEEVSKIQDILQRLIRFNKLVA